MKLYPKRNNNDNRIADIKLIPIIDEFSIAFIFLNSFSADNSAANFTRLPVNPKFPILANDVTERIRDHSPSFSKPMISIMYVYKKKAEIVTTII